MPQPLYLVGHVVVARKQTAAHRRSMRDGTLALYTLHKETCSFANKKGVQRLPAPATAYPGTVPCRYCKPTVPSQEVA